MGDTVHSTSESWRTTSTNWIDFVLFVLVMNIWLLNMFPNTYNGTGIVKHHVSICVFDKKQDWNRVPPGIIDNYSNYENNNVFLKTALRKSET